MHLVGVNVLCTYSGVYAGVVCSLRKCDCVRVKTIQIHTFSIIYNMYIMACTPS